MKAILLTVCGFFIYLSTSLGQGLTLSIPHKQVYEDQSVAIDILTLDFDSIVSAQFSLSWNPEIVHFDTSQIIDLNLVAIGINDAANGSLNISWFDLDGEGKTLEDGDVFLRLNFTAVGAIGDLSPVAINGDSLEIQVFKATPVPLEFEPITLFTEDGSIEIVDEDNPQNTFEINTVSIVDVLCNGDNSGSIELTANLDNVTYSWSGPDGYVSDEMNIENLFGGEYTLEVFDIDGNVIYEATYLVVAPLSEIIIEDIITNPSDCIEASGSAQIIVNGGTPPYTYIIANNAQFSEGNINTLSSGEYPLTIIDANECSISASFVIDQIGEFVFSLGNDIEACIGQVVSLSAGEYDAYSWSTGAIDESIDIEEAGEYTVTVVNSVGCSAIDTIEINYIEEVQLQIAQSDITICPGDSIALTVTGGVNYEWIDPTNELTDTQSGTVMVHPNENITYTVISEGDCGEGELEIPVALYQITATAGEDICVPVGETATLNGSGGSFYYWSGSEYPLNAYDIASPTASPEDSTQYFVMIIDENNCTTFDTVTVFVADDPSSFIPHINLITPNGDGQNDVLDFGDISKFGSNNIRIFNRWGKIVYEKLNYGLDEERFSGIYNGKPLTAGNYYYVLSFRDDQSIKQTLTIARDD